MEAAANMLDILVIEDSRRDADLMLHELRQAGFHLKPRITADRGETEQFLTDRPPDLVLADSSLLSFTALEVLELVRELAPGSPLIVVSDSLNHESVAEYMKAGTTDYVLKNHLAGLVPAVERAMREKALVEQHRTALRTLKYTQFAVDNWRDAAFLIGPDGRIRYANHAACERLGYSRDELLAMTVADVNPELPAAAWSAHWAKLRKRETMVFEATNRAKDGREFPVEVSILHQTCEGDEVHFALVRDITERRQAEETLRHERALAKQYLDVAGVMLIALTSDGRVVLVNPKGCDILGYPETEIVGKDWFDTFIPQSQVAAVRRVFDQVITGEVESVEYFENPVIRSDGSQRLIAWHNSVLRDRAGDISGLFSSGEDITERRIAELAIEKSERYYRTLMHSLREGLAVIDRDLVVTDVNNSVLNTTGRHRDQVVGRRCHEVLHGRAASCPGRSCPVSRVLATGKPASARHVHLQEDGSKRHVDVLCSPLCDGSGDVTHVVEAIRDVTELVDARDRLDRSEQLLRATLDGMRDGLLVADIESKRFIASNRTMSEMLGYSPDELANLGVADIHPKAYLAEVASVFEQQLEGSLAAAFDIPVRRKDGQALWMDVNGRPADVGGRKVMIGVFRDATARREQQAALEASERRFRLFFEQEPEYCYLLSPEGIIEDVNRAAVKTLGFAKAELIGQQLTRFYAPESRAKADDLLHKLLRTGELDNEELVIETVSGEKRYVLLSARLATDELGNPVRSISVQRDITELRSVEEQLRQSQKMEAIASLAGGVAHDFNNLIQSTLMFCELAAEEITRGIFPCKAINQILTNAKRSGRLTQQLLAFGRKQALEPEILDLHQVISAMDSMLRRLLGEDVVLRIILAEDLSSIFADQGQIEQVLVNLCVNAREAMPHGGFLSIEAGNVELDEEYAATHTEAMPGEYVFLAVSDSGCGMDQTTAERIYEPLFTTKSSGTGLGLSTVFGIVKQHGGHISCYSEPGCGTTFRIYLPRTDQGVVSKAAVQPTSAPRGKGETVLVVEDDDDLLQAMEKMLATAGFNVLSAADGRETLRVASRYEGRIDLLLTDVVMPGISGNDLAHELTKTWPELEILYMSGYSESVIVQKGVLGEGTHFLQKPFSTSTLVEKIRGILDRDFNCSKER